MLKNKTFLILIFIYFLQAVVYADGPFELTIQFTNGASYDYKTYQAPPGNTIKAKRGKCVIQFKVVLKNVSSSSQSLDIGSGWGGSSYGGTSGTGLITFEITDENGNNNVVTKKVDVNQSKKESYVYLGPGKSKEFEIMLTSREWDNAFKLMNTGSTRLRARASYKNRSNIIYSDYYTILLED